MHKTAAAARLAAVLAANGYTHICVLQDQVRAVKKFSFTTAVIVGLDDVGYQRRYFYEYQADA